MVRPPKLYKNDSIAIVSPSGIIDPEYVEATVENLRQWGLNPVVGQSALAVYGRYAGTDEERLKDLQWALDDEHIKAVLCSRGGYGMIHLLGKLSFRKFKEKPKWVIGYSDITALHAAIRKQGFASVHGPMCKHLATDIEKNAPSIFLNGILFGKRITYPFSTSPKNKAGEGKGILYGGNLSVLSSLRGTPYDIPSRCVLFIEDVGEAPYRIERMMYNLKLGGVLKKLSGLIVGQFTAYEEDPMMKKSLYQSIADLVSEYDYPVCFNFPVGHVERNLPLVVGAECKFEVYKEWIDLSF